MRTLERQQTIGLSVAAGIVVVVASLVAVFGIVPYPEAPLVADQPEPALPGRLAYLTSDRGDTCVHVVDGRGNDTELTCDEQLDGGAVSWTDTGYVAVQRWGPVGREEWIVDPVTGETVDLVPVADDRRPEIPDSFQPRAEAADGRVAEVSSRSGEVRVTVTAPDGARAAIWEATGPSGYRLDGITWSPDGDWLLVRDSRGDLLVLGAEGDPSPRTWAQDVAWAAAWYIREG